MKKSRIICIVVFSLTMVPAYGMAYRKPAIAKSGWCHRIRSILSNPITYDGIIILSAWQRYGGRELLTWDNAYKLAFTAFACRMLLPQEISSLFVDVPIARHFVGYRNAAGDDISETGILHRAKVLYMTQAVLHQVPIVADMAPNGELVQLHNSY